ncbi:LLM class flavin-dependent oxidoreductase [Paraburkholderia aromaticivorans]|uniref:LLM class flavin-dependent oxidoreductase n=1 Tax=Paraburkholderia aromaticivorans TaxID=2026199 RepID=UPI001456224D|nr:LLM class flavin-dependent oxidoreductase [Paraburkholderia aromaticivorans]
MEFGIYTFGDLAYGTSDPASARRRIDEIVAAAKFADEAGIDVFGVGEHHRRDFAISAPSVVLAAIAAVTRRMRLTSAVSILSSDDPVRLYQQFATLDLVSVGRAELLVGRGAYIESFPLFGHALADYESLFDEKLALLNAINDEAVVTWEGRHRPAINAAAIMPRPLKGRLPIWIAAGGTPSSAIRAGRAGLPLNLANIGGMPERFVPFIDLYRQSGIEAGHRRETLKVAISGHFHVQRDGQRARDAFFPYYRRYMANNLPRGHAEMSRQEYDALASPRGPLFVGSVQEIVDKVLMEHELFGHQRYMAQMDIGGIPFEKVRESIELLATKVAPAVRQALHQTSTVSSSSP